MPMVVQSIYYEVRLMVMGQLSLWSSNMLGKKMTVKCYKCLNFSGIDLVNHICMGASEDLQVLSIV